MIIWLHSVNTLRPRQNGRHFPDDMFKCIFLNENTSISINISLKFVPDGRINNIPALVQIMAWRRTGDKPLSEPMMVSLPTHICVTRPQWVNEAIVTNTATFTKLIPWNYQYNLDNDEVCIFYKARSANIGSKHLHMRISMRDKLFAVKSLHTNKCFRVISGPLFTQMVFTLITACASNHIHYKVWDEITNPLPSFNGATVDVWEWINNFTP